MSNAQYVCEQCGGPLQYGDYERGMRLCSRLCWHASKLVTEGRKHPLSEEQARRLLQQVLEQLAVPQEEIPVAIERILASRKEQV
jgi:hypothetical protein